jgi:hypothetical protein
VADISSNAETGRPSASYWPSALSFNPPAATAAYVSVALGGLLFALIGIAMAWSLIYIVIAALGFALCTWLAGSLARGLICIFAALGVIAALLALISRFAPGLFATLGFGWVVLFVLWWATALLAATAFRFSDLKSDYGVAEVFGCSVSIIIAGFVAAKLNFGGDLLGFLVNVEDNAAWVGISTSISSSHEVTSQFGGSTPGSVIPLLLGLLQTANDSSEFSSNAVFAAYTLCIVLTPLTATALLRSISSKPRVVTLAFAAVTIAWGFHLPQLLYAGYGHLSAILVFLGLLLTMSYVMFDRASLIGLPIGIGLVAFAAGTWFPVAPLAAAIAIALCIPFVKERGGVTTRILIVGAVGIGIVLLSVQLAIVDNSALGATKLDALRNLLSGKGGTAAIDPVLLVICLGGLIALAALSSEATNARSGLSTLLIGFVLYVGAVYALSYALQVPLSYGITKVTFILLSATAVGLVAVTARFTIPARPLAATLLVLALGSLIYGGGGELLSRAWPGEMAKPAWLEPALAAVGAAQSGGQRPIGCLSSDPGQAYFCTRWAGALTKAGDGPFIEYRTAVVSGGDVAAAVAALQSSGTLAQSDLILLTPPDPKIPWNRALFSGAGRVIGLDGRLIRRRPVHTAGKHSSD